jgi:transcription initiation factor TFIID subunit TAF12
LVSLAQRLLIPIVSALGRRVRDCLAVAGPNGAYALDPDVEQMLQVIVTFARPLIADVRLIFSLQTLALEFIENAVNVGCMFAKHRNSNVLETKDLQLHMSAPPTARCSLHLAIASSLRRSLLKGNKLDRERTWGICVPGFDEASLRQQAQQHHMLLMARQQQHANAGGAAASAYLSSSSSRTPSASLNGQGSSMCVVGTKDTPTARVCASPHLYSIGTPLQRRRHRNMQRRSRLCSNISSIPRV